MDYWDLCRPTYIENWPSALCSMSIPQVDVPLTVEEARRLGSNIMEFGQEFGLPQPANISDIRHRVSEAVGKMPNGAFVRLGSRSPKDSWEGHRNGFKIEHGTDPLRLLLDCSERIYEDLMAAVGDKEPPHIFVRQWMEIPEWSEFRCFMECRKLKGISQYQYLHGAVFHEIVEDHDAIQWVIERNFFPMFQAASHLDSVVFDVFVKKWTARDNTRIWEAKLLEINPFFELTDPCLFAWKDKFDGSFRFNK